MKGKRFFAVIYMFCVTAFFSSIVIGFARFTDERVQANRQLAFERAVLSVLPGVYDAAASGIELHQTFLDHINLPDETTAGACTLTEENKLIAYALPIEGQGFWSPIKGVIGIDIDKRTILGIAFYEQNETPGLGAQITTADFRDQFKGKVISRANKPLSLKPAGSILGVSDVHAVTGATQTSTRLEKIINNALKKWQQEMGVRD